MTYHAGLDRPLRLHCFTPSESYHCFYTKHGSTGMILAGLTFDDFLVLALSIYDLHEFKRIVKIKYSGKNLGAPRAYLG